jgi:hypothetical protein
MYIGYKLDPRPQVQLQEVQENQEGGGEDNSRSEEGGGDEDEDADTDNQNSDRDSSRSEEEQGDASQPQPQNSDSESEMEVEVEINVQEQEVEEQDSPLATLNDMLKKKEDEVIRIFVVAIICKTVFSLRHLQYFLMRALVGFKPDHNCSFGRDFRCLSSFKKDTSLKNILEITYIESKGRIKKLIKGRILLLCTNKNFGVNRFLIGICATFELFSSLIS